MAAQLRIDAARLVKEQPVLEYSHTLADPLPQATHGTGCAWPTVEDMLAQARTLRDWLAQPEQLVLLHVLKAFDVDARPPTPKEVDVALQALVGQLAIQGQWTITVQGRLP